MNDKRFTNPFQPRLRRNPYDLNEVAALRGERAITSDPAIEVRRPYESRSRISAYDLSRNVTRRVSGKK